jgi:hypothetical protein
VIVTARRVEEDVQDVPIPVAVLGEDFLADTGAYNIGKLNQLVPSVQFYSTNPRNTAINIRGLGAPFGLTNDGIEQGVGLYVDGVYFARPGVGGAGLHRCGADRGAARAAGHAVRQEHHRGRDQRHDQGAGVCALNACRAELWQSRVTCRPRRRPLGR